MNDIRVWIKMAAGLALKEPALMSPAGFEIDEHNRFGVRGFFVNAAGKRTVSFTLTLPPNPDDN